MNKEEGQPLLLRGIPSTGVQSPLNKFTTRFIIALVRLIIAVSKLIFSLSIFMSSPPFLTLYILYTFIVIKSSEKFIFIR